MHLIRLVVEGELGGTSTTLWIDACQKAKTDPRELIKSQHKRLLKHVLGASESIVSCFSLVTVLTVIEFALFFVGRNLCCYHTRLCGPGCDYPSLGRSDIGRP